MDKSFAESMSLEFLFAKHQARVLAWADAALEHAREQNENFDGIVFHAGSSRTYFADDLEVPFRTHAHFLRLAPIPGPDHLLLYRPGSRPRVLRSVVSDYWNAKPVDLDDWIASGLDIEICADVVASWAKHKPAGRWALIGGDNDVAGALGIARECVDPPALLAALDWTRATKTDYEIVCLREAQHVAGRGHAALREAIGQRLCEFDLHIAYLAATRQTEHDLPYPNIIAWDEASAVLHYQHRRRDTPSSGRNFLVDAGAGVRGYASDITRTYCLASGESASAEFRGLVDGMEALQQGLVAQVSPGKAFVELHRNAESSIAGLLCEAGVFKVKPDEARERGLVRAFFPHGLGHFLGLQVHDVGGRQASVAGGIAAPPADCPKLRTTRTLEAGHVVTIEPGLYFIASLLEALRASEAREAIDWSRVDALSTFGGIRIEDDVLVTPGGRENLTRPFVSGHREAPRVPDDLQVWA